MLTILNLTKVSNNKANKRINSLFLGSPESTNDEKKKKRRNKQTKQNKTEKKDRN